MYPVIAFFVGFALGCAAVVAYCFTLEREQKQMTFLGTVEQWRNALAADEKEVVNDVAAEVKEHV